MNAVLRNIDVAPATATLSLFALFHLNLAFSSIEESDRGKVIERCYWPLLDLAQAHGPIGLEITGYTLAEIAKRDPEWIGRARSLIRAGKIELIGSGYAQIIGPLVPARVTEANLRLGNDIYRKLFGCVPTLALVNEQAYSAGLVGLYLDAGYRAILMDWDNPGAAHPEWPAETRYLPQRALGADGRSIGLLWTSTVAFQKLQRLAHGDIALDDYLDHLNEKHGDHPRVLCAYASDAEIFDYRPGRYRTEEAFAGESEWKQVEHAFAAMHREFALIAPGQALSLANDAAPLRLESAAVPVPVKKQRKYNLSRWAVTGRDDIAINAACQRIYEALMESGAADQDWKELCYLWSSDFRTHITEKRWSEFCSRLREAESKYLSPPTRGETGARSVPGGEQGAIFPHTAHIVPSHEGIGRHIDIRTPALAARIDRRRGLAIERLTFAGDAKPLLGGLPHGHFDDIALQADWYTGDCVFEAPGEHKVTDLEWCVPHIVRDATGDAIVSARIETPKGPIDKVLRFAAGEPRVDFDLTFHWDDWGKGSLRLGHITLLPDAFDWASLSLTTHNGGKEFETFSLNGQTVDHGAPVSFLVSCSQGLGMTEGWAVIGDGEKAVRIAVDRRIAPLLGLFQHRHAGGSLFCQFVLSALELDETRKPADYRKGPRRFCFSITRCPPVAGY